MCDAAVGYSALALGYQAHAGDTARAVGAKEPTIGAFLATVALRLQFDNWHYAYMSTTGYNLLHISGRTVRLYY